MSTHQKSLTQQHEHIVDALANDYENLQTIAEVLGVTQNGGTITASIWELVSLGYIECFVASKDTMQRVADPKREALNQYWFSLSSTGERLLGSLN